jgi:glutaredoxin
MFRTLFSFFSRRKPNWPGRMRACTILIYTRRGCHLCEEACKDLERQQTRYRYTLEIRDVDTDPALAAAHGEWVPVVLVNGKVRFRGRVNPVLLERLLCAEGQSR